MSRAINAIDCATVTEAMSNLEKEAQNPEMAELQSAIADLRSKLNELRITIGLKKIYGIKCGDPTSDSGAMQAGDG